jgi:hypothetical protein
MSVPLSYLMEASDETLCSFAVARLNQAANLSKEAKAITLEAENLRIEAGIAQWLRENRQAILQDTGKHLERVTDVQERESAA